MHTRLTHKIRRIFNRAADSYDASALLQKSIFIQLFNLSVPFLQKETFKLLVDLGCATGTGTLQLQEQFPTVQCIGLDLAPLFIKKAQTRERSTFSPKWMVADFNQNIFRENTIDVFFANMALHWSVDLPKTLQLLFQQLKHEGVLVFSVPLLGSLCELRSASLNPFYSFDQLRELLKKENFSILALEQKQECVSFSEEQSALKFLKMTGCNCVLQTPKKGLGKTSVRSFFKESFPGYLSFKILYVVAKKKHA